MTDRLSVVCCCCDLSTHARAHMEIDSRVLPGITAYFHASPVAERLVCLMLFYAFFFLSLHLSFLSLTFCPLSVSAGRGNVNRSIACNILNLNTKTICTLSRYLYKPSTNSCLVDGFMFLFRTWRTNVFYLFYLCTFKMGSSGWHWATGRCEGRASDTLTRPKSCVCPFVFLLWI